jgi:hypothetical protein
VPPQVTFTASVAAVLPVRVTLKLIGFGAVSEPASSVDVTETAGGATVSLSAMEPLALAGFPSM